MLIESFSEYPARRREIQSALQVSLVHTLSPYIVPSSYEDKASACIYVSAEVLTVWKDGPSTDRPCKNVKYMGTNLADNETGYTTEHMIGTKKLYDGPERHLN